MSAIRERDWWIEFVYTCLKQNARSGTRLHEHGGHPERLRSGEVLHAVLEKRRCARGSMPAMPMTSSNACRGGVERRQLKLKGVEGGD